MQPDKRFLIAGSEGERGETEGGAPLKVIYDRSLLESAGQGDGSFESLDTGGDAQNPFASSGSREAGGSCAADSCSAKRKRLDSWLDMFEFPWVGSCGALGYCFGSSTSPRIRVPLILRWVSRTTEMKSE